MSYRLIMALIKKDLKLFSRDRFYFILTIVGLVMYIVLYFIMPQAIDETITVGIYAPGVPALTGIGLKGQGVEVESFASLDELKDAVGSNRCPAAIALPADFIPQLTAGQRPEVTVYFSGGTPEEVKGAITSFIGHIAYLISGQTVPVDIQEEVLGEDMLGQQVPWRNRLIPMLTALILGMETLSLASLINVEMEQNTAQALLVTPLRLRHLLSAKAILGIGLAFAQVVLFLAVIGGLNKEPLAVLLTLLIGSVMVTGMGFLVASLSRDMMGVTAWGMITIIIFFIPTIGALIPGLISGWVKALPSYHLTDAISRLVNYGGGLGDVSNNLLILLAWSAGLGLIGTTALRRRLR